MFRKDYDIMTSMYVDVNACIEAYMTSGEYNHHAYHPIRDMLSGILDITVVKPIIECFTGTDLITGERLTETEKAWKAAGAAIDAITFGQGTTALKGVKLFSSEAFETIGRTFMWDLVSESAAYGINYAGQQIGMPEGFNWILTAATGMTVSMAGNKFILEGVDGTTVKKSFKEMKEWLVEKLRKSEGGSVPDFYVGPNGKALPSQYKDWIGTNIQKELLDQAENPQLQNAIKQLYRGNSFIGDGGTADVIRFEQQTGLMLGKNGGSHVQKGIDMAKYIENKILTQDLSPSDRALATQLLEDLYSALGR